MALWPEQKWICLGLVTSCHISWKVALPSQIAHPSLNLQAVDSIQKGGIAWCLVPLKPPLLPPMVGFIGPEPTMFPVFLCWKFKSLNIFLQQRSLSNLPAMHSPHPRQECYHKNDYGLKKRIKIKMKFNYFYFHICGLAYKDKDIVFRFIIKYNSLRDFGPS
jgi:hypothetical protein